MNGPSDHLMVVVKTIERADGKRRVLIVLRSDGLYGFREELVYERVCQNFAQRFTRTRLSMKLILRNGRLARRGDRLPRSRRRYHRSRGRDFDWQHS